MSWQPYCTASSSGRQPNFTALNRGRHLCSVGRPSRWALAHILVCVNLQQSLLKLDYSQEYRRHSHYESCFLCDCCSCNMRSCVHVRRFCCAMKFRDKMAQQNGRRDIGLSHKNIQVITNKNSSGDEIANVNFFYNIAHVEASAYAH